MIPRHYLVPFFVALLLLACSHAPESGNSLEVIKTTQSPLFKIQLYDSTALKLIDTNATFEVLAEGFSWSEGPLWVEELDALLFSDVPANTIYKWHKKEGLSSYLKPSGHTRDAPLDSDKGSNGLLLDKDNQLILCQHGDRRIAVMGASINQPKPSFTVLTDTFKGQPFNSPNDLAIDSEGNIYFTDPPYGQPNNQTGTIGFNGLFKVNSSGEVTLLVDSLSWPNGVALSNDQHTLYVNQSDPQRPFLYQYDITEDGLLANGQVLFDFTSLLKTGKGLPDGIKVHKSGHLFVTGPGGVHILQLDGKRIATLYTGKATSNCAFDTKFNYIYLTTTDLLLRMPLE